MLKVLVLIILCYGFAFMYRQRRYNARTLELIRPINHKMGIRIIDHDMINKTIYEKFEYYSLMGNKKKQMECLEEILEKAEKKTFVNI